MKPNELSSAIIGAAIETQKTLGGPGLLEAVYEEALCHELGLKNIASQRQVSVPIEYKGTILAKPLVVDLIVNNTIIVENKTVSEHNPLFESQLLTYLRLCDLNLGLVINFGIYSLKNGIKRVVNNLKETSSAFAPLRS